MARPRTPWWLSEPTRFTALRSGPARIRLALLGLLMLVSLSAVFVADPRQPEPAATSTSSGGGADIALYQSIVLGVRYGGDYYEVAATALRRGDYPLRPFVTFRLPTLAVVQAWLAPELNVALLLLLDAGVVLAWFVRLRPAFTRPLPIAIAMLLLLGGLTASLQPALTAFHEIWAGPLIALSLALWRPGRWVEAAAIGMIAMLVRETAALYVVIMATAAMVEGRRREAIGWGATLALFAGVLALHAHAVAQVVKPLDPASPGWAGMLGLGFFFKTMALSTALNLAPGWLGAMFVGLALFGWAAWRQAVASRALATFAAYAVVLALFGRLDTFYWGLLVAPVILVGLVFVPDALADLVAAALDSRRITVIKGGTRGIR